MDGLLDSYLIPVVNGVAYGLVLFTLAVGLTLAFGVARMLNLAHGVLFVAGGYVAVELINGSWLGLGVAVLAAAAVGAVAGGGLSLAAAPLAGRGHLAQALLTFGIAMVGEALLIEAFGPDPLRVEMPSVLAQPVDLLGHRYPADRLVFIGVALVLAIACWYVVTRTRAGAWVRAMVDDREMVAALGVNPQLVLAGVLAAGGALAAIAGVLGASIFQPGPGTANRVLLYSLIIVVLGGLGSISGAFVAAIAVGQIQNVGVTLLPDVAPYMLFGAMAVILLVRTQRAAMAGGTA